MSATVTSSSSTNGSERRPLGVFGGTFDPVHDGHLRLAEEAVEALGLANVRWIPAGDPRHRPAPQVAAAERLAMVRLATAGNPRFTVDPAEVDSGDASYTVPTLERLRQTVGNEVPLVLLLGADAFAGLPGWHRWRDLFDLAHIAVAHRPGFALSAETLPAPLTTLFTARSGPAEALMQAPAGRIASFALTPLAISATRIRDDLRHHRSVRYLLPEAVFDYIRNRNLYQCPP